MARKRGKKSVKIYSKTYTKTHKSSKAAKNHESKIRKRGGVVHAKKTASGTKLEYSFKK